MPGFFEGFQVVAFDYFVFGCFVVSCFVFRCLVLVVGGAVVFAFYAEGFQEATYVFGCCRLAFAPFVPGAVVEGG